MCLTELASGRKQKQPKNTYTGHCQKAIHQKRRTDLRFEIRIAHMLEKNALVEKLRTRMIPCKVERDKMRYQIVTFCDLGPWACWYFKQWYITEVLQQDTGIRIHRWPWGYSQWLKLFWRTCDARIAGVRSPPLSHRMIPII